MAILGVSVTKNKIKNELFIKVQDTGIGFEKEEFDKVFERFYQSDNAMFTKEKGSGIGLNYTKQLIELMGGKISIDSKIAEGTSISFYLPITKNTKENELDFNKIGIDQRVSEDYAKAEEFTKVVGTTLLVVEDNASIRTLLGQQLGSMYNILFANDGDKGIEKAITEIPDLVLSDVMMPKKSGYELCNTLKEDKRTSHIPIILLTAKADQFSKIEGLEAKADAYIYKPYDIEELQLQIKNLLAVRKQLQKKYKKLNKNSLPTEKPKEDQFILELRELILKNMRDTDFGINSICDQLKISRSQLHKKVKALTGLSTSNYINKIKLTKAKELLAKTSLNINEVMFETGETNQSYFSTKFKQEFGMSPKKFRENLTENP